MGLDQYWLMERSAEEKVELSLTGESDPHEYIEIGYHRKFYDLNEYIAQHRFDWFDSFEQEEDTYGDDFNCSYTLITASAYDSILEWAQELLKTYAKTVEEVPEDESAQWELEDAEELCNEILPAIQGALIAGRKVYYHPWW